MTPAEADRRIMLSRTTLAKYRTLPDGPTGPTEDMLALVGSEVDLLGAIAAEHPGKAEKIAALVAGWRAFAKRLAH